MEIRSLTLVLLNSFNVCLIYRIRTLEHPVVSFFLILDSLNKSEVIEVNFENSVLYGVVNRDKVGNCGWFDDKTLFRNVSNLHKQRALTHDISR